MGRRKRQRASRGVLDVRSLSDEQLAEKLSELLESGKYQRSIELGKEIRRRGASISTTSTRSDSSGGSSRAPGR